MPNLRISDGVITNDIQLLDVVPSGRYIKMGDFYLPLTDDKSFVHNYPTLKLNDGIKDYYPISDTREILPITFNGTWIPSETFNTAFELLDDSGNVVETANSSITKYRVKYDWYNGNITDINHMFTNCNALISITLPSDWAAVTNVTNMFLQCASVKYITLPNNWGNVISAGHMFANCTSLISVNLPPNWGNVTTVQHMFFNCTSMPSIVLPDDWGNVTSTTNMFVYCIILNNINLPASWNKITDVSYMFFNCVKLPSIILPNTWNNVVTTSNMFVFCTSLNNITLPSNWNKITNVESMFFNCTSFKYKSSGKLISTGYYQSSANGRFPSECYRNDLSLNF